jgi:hypothetical protein
VIRYLKAAWEYPREPSYWTYPANQLTIGRIVDGGVEYPVSGDLSVVCLHHVDLGIPAPHYRNEDLQQKEHQA